MIVGAIGLGIGGSASAQQASSDQQATAVKEVVVTGSRIPRPNLSSESPITSVSAQDVKLSGTTDISDLLNQFPQIQYEFGNQPNTLGTNGVSTVSLRGLGSKRTLVLEDGKRLAPGDPSTPVPNLDNIPSALIDHVELVTGGASAVYGSDALAGVVNFVMKKNFEGLQIDAQTGVFQDENDNGEARHALNAAATAGHVGPIPNVPGDVWDGQTHQVTITFGMNSPDNKGNITAYLSYRHADPIKEGSRDYSACQITASATCTGSSNSNILIDTASGAKYEVSGNNFVPYTTAGLTPPDHFNANVYETMNRQDDRYTSGFKARYAVNSWLEVYSDFNFMHDHTVHTAGPSAIFQQLSGPGAAAGGFLVNCDNPELSAQQVAAVCTSNGLGPNDYADLIIGRRNVEGGARVYTEDHNTFRDVVGARGDLGDAWHYDLYGEYGFTQAQSSVQHDLSISKIANALQVRSVGGVNECIATINGTDPNCVPYNIFQTGGVTPAALAYISQSGTTSGTTSEQVVALDMTGKLGKYGIISPWAKEGVGIAFGAEYRRESLTNTPDQTSLSGDLAGAGGASPPTSGAFSTKEIYFELRVPIVEDKPFVKELSVDGGYRRADYSSIGNIESTKLAGEYAPTRDIRFRGSFQRAIRAPNVLELYSPPVITNGSGFVDPCAGGGGGAGAGGGALYTAAQCAKLGVTAAEYGNGNSTNTILACPAGQCSVAIGGNPRLQAERSDTTDLGFVFTPTFFRNFSLSLDYFNITINDAINAPLAPSQIMNECAVQNISAYCGLVVRTSNGFLFGNSFNAGGYVEQGLVNIGSVQTSGLDLEAAYRLPLSTFGFEHLGVVNFSLDGTYTSHYRLNTPGVGTFDCAGLFGSTCGQPLPRWRHYARATWATPWKVDASLAWRFYGGAKLDNNSGQPLLNSGGAFDKFDASVPSFSYFDMSVIWHVRDNIRLRAGVNNIFDTHPPLLQGALVGSGTPNSYPIYDEFGREIFMGLTADF